MNFIKINEMEEINNYIHSVKNSILFIVKEGTEGFYGRICGEFGFIYGDKRKGLIKIINNFLAYELKTGRKPFLFLLKNAQIDENDLNISINDEWVVHSTDEKSLESIIKMGKLLSRIELDKQKINYLDFGREYLNEPIDYYDLIEFGDINGPGGEIVVASKTQKRFVNENEEYNPGGRIYIKKETLAKQKGYIDFLDHYCIKGSLNLSDVKYEIVSARDFKNKKWTPKIFSEEANKLFEGKIKN